MSPAIDNDPLSDGSYGEDPQTSPKKRPETAAHDGSYHGLTGVPGSPPTAAASHDTPAPKNAKRDSLAAELVVPESTPKRPCGPSDTPDSSEKKAPQQPLSLSTEWRQQLALLASNLQEKLPEEQSALEWARELGRPRVPCKGKRVALTVMIEKRMPKSATSENYYVCLKARAGNWHNRQLLSLKANDENIRAVALAVHAMARCAAVVPGNLLLSSGRELFQPLVAPAAEWASQMARPADGTAQTSGS